MRPPARPLAALLTALSVPGACDSQPATLVLDELGAALEEVAA